MKLKDMTVEELELLSYGDLALLELQEKKVPMNTPTLFKEICNLLGYTDDEYASKIGDFYTSLNNDKRFLLLDGGKWDLSSNHSVEFVVDDEDEEEVETVEEDEEEEISNDDIDNIDDDNELDDEDDLEDLSIVEDDEETED